MARLILDHDVAWRRQKKKKSIQVVRKKKKKALSEIFFPDHFYQRILDYGLEGRLPSI